MKKALMAIMVFAFVLSVSGPVMAAEEKKSDAQTADDIKWVSKCMDDNKDQGQPLEVVRKYCECMNEKMDQSETQSITQWEKSHPKERKECDEKAGWK